MWDTRRNYVPQSECFGLDKKVDELTKMVNVLLLVGIGRMFPLLPLRGLVRLVEEVITSLVIIQFQLRMYVLVVLTMLIMII